MKHSKTIIIASSIVIIIGLIKIFYIDRHQVYIGESTFNQKIQRQEQANRQTLEQLGKYGINNESILSLDFFFYTNEREKADNLSVSLKQLGNKVDPVKKAAGDSTLWIVTGWSVPIKMDITSVTNWTTEMTKLGYKNDCDFDGWGTNPDQGDFDVENGLTPQQYYEQGTALFEQGQARKAEAYFTKVISLDDKAVLSYYSRAHIKASTGRLPEAIEDYTNALLNDSTFYEALENRGAVKDEMGDYDGAIADYSKAIKVNPNSQISFLNRGNSKFRKKDNRGACDDWNKAKLLGDKTAKENIIKYCK